MIASRIAEIRGTLPSPVALMAVTKGRGVEEIKVALSAGVSIIGENYVQEAASKYPLLKGVEKHFIGHLQRNKVKKALELFDWIDSVDSVELAQEISKRAARNVPILVQVNAGSERQKSGVEPSGALPLIREISKVSNITVKGLQIVAPLPSDPEDSRLYFREMKRLFDSIQKQVPNVEMKVLSMGTTIDYMVAIQEGSTMVRIGEGIFGKRMPHTGGGHEPVR
jgi:pyridoxal phosphate enzyme (YggS family)